MPGNDRSSFSLTTSCRNALVTGASRGIGRGAALALAEIGCNVVINYLSGAEEAEAVASEIAARGLRALTVQADVSDSAQVEEMVERAERELGPIDCLVVNAAFSIRKPWVEYTLDEIAHTLNVSLFGAIYVSHAVGRRMVARRTAGKVVFISSLHAEAPFTNCAAYNIAKAGMQQLALSLAAEWAQYRINVNVIQPGWIDTPGEERMKGREAIERRGLTLPWGRLGTVREIGEAVAFLCSDQAGYISGAVLRVDGALGVTRRI